MLPLWEELCLPLYMTAGTRSFTWQSQIHFYGNGDSTGTGWWSGCSINNPYIVVRTCPNEKAVFLQRADSWHVHMVSSVSMFVLLSACVRAHLKACLSGSQGWAARTCTTRWVIRLSQGGGRAGLTSPIHHSVSLNYRRGDSLLQGPGRAAASKNPH